MIQYKNWGVFIKPIGIWTKTYAVIRESWMGRNTLFTGTYLECSMFRDNLDSN